MIVTKHIVAHCVATLLVSATFGVLDREPAVVQPNMMEPSYTAYDILYPREQKKMEAEEALEFHGLLAFDGYDYKEQDYYFYRKGVKCYAFKSMKNGRISRTNKRRSGRV